MDPIHNPPIPTPVVPPPPKRRLWLTALLMAILFLSGAVCGGGVTAILLVRQARQRIQNPQERPQVGARWMARQLDLTPQQVEQVREILQRQAQDLQRMRQEMMPQVRERLRETEDEVAAVLTPEQEQEWRRIAGRVRQQWMPPQPGIQERPAPGPGGPMRGPGRRGGALPPAPNQP